MKFLVLGGTGLAGSALVHVLGGLGHTVSAPTRAEYDILRGPLPGRFWMASMRSSTLLCSRTSLIAARRSA